MEAFYLPTERGQRFCILHSARGTARGAVLYVPPFGDEMNKSRRMAALQARAFRDIGFDVLQIDLQGCGDSADDFSEATWQAWREDVQIARSWLSARTDGPIWLWGLRTGCLLASEVAAQDGKPARLLYWQPVLSGRRYLQQFLRTRALNESFGGRNTSIEALRERLARQGMLEVGGYPLSDALAQGVENANLSAPPAGSQLRWLEVAASQDQTLSPQAAGYLASWRETGCEVFDSMAEGPAFWQTQELTECPALIKSTISSMPQ